MKKILSIVGLIAAMILTGCGAPAPDVEGQDWCYIFDFTQNPQGFLLTTGTWTSQGILSDGTGLLQTSYGYDRFVEPSYVIVTVVRPTGITGDISATAAGVIFGVSASFTATLPGGTDEAQLTFTPSTVGAAGTDVNITIDASQPIGIESIDIRGMGGSPFNFNPCSDSTPTPFGITPSGTATSALTATLDPSITPTMTATPCSPLSPGEGEWVYGDIVSEAGGTWVVDATAFELGYHIEWGATDGSAGTVLWDSYTVNIGSVNSGSTMDASGTLVPLSSLPQTVQHISLYSPDPLRITFVFEGGAVCDPTPTPSPTYTLTPATPLPTYTPEPLWSACLDFTVGQFAFTGTDATYEAGTGWIQDAGEWSIGRAGVGPSGKKKFKFTFDGAWAGSIRLTNTGGTPATGWKLGSGSQFVLDFSDQSWTPTQNLFIQFDGNFGPYALEQMCWVDLNPATNTPGPGSTSTPAGTRTPLATGTARPNPSRTPVVVQPPVILLTATNGGIITATPMWGTFAPASPTGSGSGGTPSGSGTPTIEATGGPSNTSGISTCIKLTASLEIGNCGQDGDQSGLGVGIGEALEILGFLWGIGWGLLGALFAYLGQATQAVTVLLGAFANATPQPIPGLPLCITNPMAHDLCAIYYVMDNTFLAPTTPGQYIIPLLQIIFNVAIAIFFVRFVLRIIRRGENITSVD